MSECLVLVQRSALLRRYQTNYRVAPASVAGIPLIHCVEVFRFALLLGEISGTSNLVRVQLLFSIYIVRRASLPSARTFWLSG